MDLINTVSRQGNLGSQSIEFAIQVLDGELNAVPIRESTVTTGRLLGDE